MYVCVGNVRLLLYLSYHVIPFIPSRRVALVSPAAAVQLPGNRNDDDDDDDGVDPSSFADDSTSNPRIDVVPYAITGNAEVSIQLKERNTILSDMTLISGIGTHDFAISFRFVSFRFVSFCFISFHFRTKLSCRP